MRGGPGDEASRRRGRVLRGLARNPSVPWSMVERLIGFPDVAAQAARWRGDITDDLADAILRTGDRWACECLGHNDRTPTSVRWRLATHPEPQVRASAARHGRPENIPAGCEVTPALLARLADDRDAGVRAAVAEHPNTPDAVRVVLAADPSAEVRTTLATWWRQAPEPIRRVLLTDTDAKVRAAAVSPWHSPPPTDLHPVLLTDPATRHRAVPFVVLTAALAADLAGSEDELVRAALARHPDLPATICDRLVDDPAVAVRLALVCNPNLPHASRAQVCTGFEAATGTVEQWIIEHHLANAWRDKASLGWLWQAPIEQRMAYLDAPHFFLRRGVAAASHDLPRAAVDRLLADPDIETRRITARVNPDVPGPVLQRLVTDHGETSHLRPLLVDHPNFPPAAFTTFATSDRAELRRLACRHRGLAPGLLARLAADCDPTVRRAAARHPHLPARCLPALLADDDLETVESAAQAPALPVTWMIDFLNQEERERSNSR